MRAGTGSGVGALICHECGQVVPQAQLGDRCPIDQTALIPEDEHKRGRTDAFLGRVFAGKYPVIGKIGAGGMGAVYRALQEPVGREVAIKVIKGEHDPAAAEALQTRFFREAKIVAQLANPSVVTLYDYGAEPDGVLFMVLELVRGQRLDELLAEEGALPPERAVPMMRQVLKGLSAAHELGLVHRDLKPENLMILKGAWGEEQIKILDFGIAKVLDTEGPLKTQETRSGLVMGTPRYMAPEQATGQGADCRSDLYALGVVLFEMLTGTVPFAGNTPFEVLLAHRSDPVPPIPKSMNVPAAVERAMRKALEKELAARYQSAKEMADALDEALATPDDEEQASSEEATFYEGGGGEGSEEPEEPPTAIMHADTSGLEAGEEEVAATLARAPAFTPRPPTPAPRAPTPHPKQPTPRPKQATPAPRSPTPFPRPPPRQLTPSPKPPQRSETVVLDADSPAIDGTARMPGVVDDDLALADEAMPDPKRSSPVGMAVAVLGVLVLAVAVGAIVFWPSPPPEPEPSRRPTPAKTVPPTPLEPVRAAAGPDASRPEEPPDAATPPPVDAGAPPGPDASQPAEPRPKVANVPATTTTPATTSKPKATTTTPKPAKPDKPKPDIEVEIF